MSRRNGHLRAPTASSPEAVLYQRARDPSSLFYLDPPAPEIRRQPLLDPKAPDTLDRRLAAALGLDLGRCLVCGGVALPRDSDEGYLLLTCLGLCGGTHPGRCATLATWLQRRRSCAEYRCSRVLFAVKHALRHVQAGVLEPHPVTLNRHARRALANPGRDGDRAALAVHVLSVTLAARMHACPSLTVANGFPLTAGFIHWYVRRPDGTRISRKLAARLITLLTETQLITPIAGPAGRTKSARGHDLVLYTSRRCRPIPTGTTGPTARRNRHAARGRYFPVIPRWS